MVQKVARQEEEKQTLQRFIENRGEEFYPDLVNYLGIQEPCDVSYKGIEYQITYGDQKLIGELRKKTSEDKIYCGIRNLSESYAETFIYEALKKKKDKSSDKVTLLIHCNFAGIYASLAEREIIFKKYFAENQDLGGSWQHIFIVFSDGNIKLC